MARTYRVTTLVIVVLVALLATMLAPAHAQGYYWFYNNLRNLTCTDINANFVSDDLYSIPASGYQGRYVVTTDQGHLFDSGLYVPGALVPGTTGTLLDDNWPSNNYPAVPAAQAYTLTYVLYLYVNSAVVSTSTAVLNCSAAPRVMTLVSLTNSSTGGTAALPFEGPGLPGPDGRNLVLLLGDTAVLDSPGGTPTGNVIKACQTTFITETSSDGKYGKSFVMGGWISLAATMDVAEDYGQPGGAPIYAPCVGK